MSSMEFTLQDKGVLASLCGGISGLTETLYSDIPGCNIVVEELMKTVAVKFKKSGIKLSDPTVQLFIEFFCKSSVLAYFQRFDNDVDWDALREKYRVHEEPTGVDDSDEDDDEDVFDMDFDDEDEDEKPPKQEDVKYSVPTDFQFGFKGYATIIQSTVSAILQNMHDNDEVVQRISTNLLTNIRDIEVSEYLDQKKYICDMYLIAILGEKSEVKLNDFIVDFIKTDSMYLSLYQSTVDGIKTVYKYLFQDSFSLKGYAGVLSLARERCLIISPGYVLSSDRKAVALFRGIAKKFKKYYDVTEVGQRQFNIEDIVKKSGEKPYYHANKILEYAMGRELTYNLSKDVYRPYPNVNSYEAYEKQYVAPQIEKYVMQAIYYAIEKHFDFSAIGMEGVKHFTDAKFDAVQNSFDLQDSVIDQITEPSTVKAITKDLYYVQQCLCCGIIISEYNHLGGAVNGLRVRVCDVFGNMDLDITGDILSGASTNQNIEYQPGYEVTEGVVLSDGRTPVPFKVYEYAHNYNQGLTDAEPLFGYTAVQRFIEQGKPITWDSILLGEDRKGTSVFANVKDSACLPMQRNMVHNIIAGSRSGKGVMTMNILASAVAAGKPIFYIDRKPDMSVMFYEKSGGNMFIVNGGAYMNENDPRGVWSSTGSATQGWQEAYDMMPDYLRNKFFQQKKYDGNFGDYVYWRAIMFALGILVARATLKTSAHYNRLGGDTGLVFVFDEFNGFQANFETKAVNFSSIPGSSLIAGIGEQAKKMQTAESNLEIAKANLASAEDEKEAKKYQNKIRSEQAAIKAIMGKEEVKLGAYTSQLAHLLVRDEGIWSDYINASSKNGRVTERDMNDIFVIGQNINLPSMKDFHMPPFKTDGTFNMTGVSGSTSIIRSILNSLDGDCFIGNNTDNPTYFGRTKTEGGKTVTDKGVAELHDRSFWAYCHPEDINSIKTSKPAKVRWFKPYLVLNNNREEDPNAPRMIEIPGSTEPVLDPDYNYVRSCRGRIQKTAGGKDLWQEIRLKHLKPGLLEQVTETEKFYDQLNDGIGFEGLVELTKRSCGEGSVDLSTDLGGSKAIADYVAQQMGYPTYQSLLFDFRPEAMFTFGDVVESLRTPGYFQDYKTRLSIAWKYGLFGNAEVNDSDYGEGFNEDDYRRRLGIEDDFDAFGYGDEEEEEAGSDSYDFGDEYSSGNTNSQGGMPSGSGMGTGGYTSPHNMTLEELFNSDDEDDDFFEDEQEQPENSFELSESVLKQIISETIEETAQKRGMQLTPAELNTVLNAVMKSVKGVLS